MASKQRIDAFLVEKGIVDSREKAKKLIMSGNIFVNNERVDKPGHGINTNDNVEVRGDLNAYVSRGGLKLEKAIDNFNICVRDAIAMDIGASTGGFTDCLLRAGAKKVYAIDVGYGQLDWKLRQDPRVVVLERTNIRYITPEQVPDQCDLATIDVSFISLKLVIPPMLKHLKNEGQIIALVKPQFEAGRGKVGKNGVVRQRDIHYEVLYNIVEFVLQESLQVKNLSFSPITGPKGNIEFLLHMRKSSEKSSQSIHDMEQLINQTVANAHQAFGKE